MTDYLENKRNKGQFFTIANPFKSDHFYKWYEAIPNIADSIILEPFAGSNNIIDMIQNINVEQPRGWRSYDIEPSEVNKTPEYPVEYRDTLSDFPEGYRVGITNPPYLAKNSATRRGLYFPNTEYDDMYKESLDKMLSHLEYVAAIIPESFITSGLFTERLDKIISLNTRMFDDTDTPVCLALFNGEDTEDTEIYRGDEYLGLLSELEHELSHIINVGLPNGQKIDFNMPDGNIGARLVDDTKGDSIQFFKGEELDSSKVKPTSRTNTRISGLSFDSDLERVRFIEIANNLLMSYRKETKDVFMTSFKGLRSDGKYRRRLDYKTARSLLARAYVLMKEDDVSDE